MKDEMTRKYYEDNAMQYASVTVHADMHETCDRFLSFIKEKGHILDFGCGSGRDSLYFKKRGYEVTALDGSKALCDYAEKLLQQPVICMDFMAFDECDVYDGIWACASLLHYSKDDLSLILRKLHTALKKNGILYMSFKYGSFSGYRDGRYYLDMDEETLGVLLSNISGFGIEEVWVSEDVQKRQEQWLNVLLRKVDEYDH